MEDIFHDISTVVAAAAVLSVIAHYTRQPLIIAYMLTGVLIGPLCFDLVHGDDLVRDVSKLGITLLLFLAGMELQPRKLLELLKMVVATTVGTTLLFGLVGFGFAKLWGFGTRESAVIGTALTFSSTILVVKLLPTIALHQKHMGAICIALLIAQDLVAISALILVGSGPGEGGLLMLPLRLVALVTGTLLVERFFLRPIMHQISHFHETLYLVALGHCMGSAMVAHQLGLSHEVGAFVAGFSLAQCRISTFIVEGLKPFRDFFLTLFFVALGIQLDLATMADLLLPAALLAAILLGLKPLVYQRFFGWFGEPKIRMETGMRLGQCSEFALIMAVMALSAGHIGDRASQFIQLVTILTMLVSSYIVVFKYPSPLGRKGLKQD